METVLTPIERLELVSRTLPHHIATLIWDVCADAKADAAIVARVRELHAPVDIADLNGPWWGGNVPSGSKFCDACMDNSGREYSQPYPCPTIKALEGGQA